MLFIGLAKAEEIGYSDKIEATIENCANCNVCPDGKILENEKICLYLFWGQGCPHCAEEKPFLEELKGKYPKLEVYEFEVFYNQDNVKLWENVCKKYGLQPVGVPMTFIGNKAFIGFSREKSENSSSPYSSNLPHSSINLFLILIILIPSILLALLLFKRKIRIKVKI